MATKKRTVDDAAFEVSIPSSKRRKLNENGPEEPIPLSTQSPSTCASATNPSIKGVNTTEITPPACNPAVNNVNIETSNAQNTDSQNDHTAKAKIQNDTNHNASNWSFGNNAWVRQSSNASATDAQPIPDTTSNASNVSAFNKFEGMGFQQHLNDENSKHAETKQDTKAANNDPNDAQNNNKKEADNPWKNAWTNSNNNNETFNFTFKWNDTWKTESGNIDLSPNSKIGYGSHAKTHNPDDIEADDGTKQVVEQMGGAQDTGDAEDDVKYNVHCKVYNLESGRYVERGKGILKLNTYTVNVKEEGGKKLRGRILCRRDQTLTTLINAPILKDMKFERANNFIRFGVVNVMEKENVDGDDEEQVKKEVVKEEEKVKKEENANEDDDMDMQTDIKTYLVRPMDKTQLDILLNKIKEIQEQIG